MSWVMPPSLGMLATDIRPLPAIVESKESRDLSVTLSFDEDRPWLDYLEGLEVEALLTPQHANKVRAAWQRIRERVGTVPLPLSQFTPEGALQLAWDTGTRTLQLDIFEDGFSHWFYRDRTSAEVDGSEDRVLGVPRYVINRLKQVLASSRG